MSTRKTYIVENLQHERVKGQFPIQRIKPIDTTNITNQETGNSIEYQIEKLLDKRITQNGQEYLVKWKNFHNKHNEWIRESQVMDKTLLEKFKTQRKKLKFCPINVSNYLTLIIICALFGLTMAENLIANRIIKEDLYYCQLHKEDSPVLDLTNSCKPEQTEDTQVFDQPKLAYNVQVLNKVHYEINGEAIECSMEAVTATMSENIFGSRAKEEERYKLQLTRKECLQMHDTKRCKWHPLKCIEGNCHYNGEPKEVYNYWTSHKETGYNCQLSKRNILAKNLESSVFDKKCKAKDLECKIGDKIIIWQDEVVRKCPLQQILMIKNATLTGNRIIDNKHKHTFFIKTRQNYCNMSLFETTTGLFINTDAPNEQHKFVDKTNSKENSLLIILIICYKTIFQFYLEIEIEKQIKKGFSDNYPGNRTAC